MIVDNYKIIEEKVAERCIKIGRNPDEVTIVAVSKTQPLSAIYEANNAGVLNFGENKAQELRDKFSESNRKVNWHFIGHLQSNKVKYVVEPSALIHSVESEKIIDEINKKAASIDKVQDVLLEVNTSGEESKFGLNTEDEINRLVEYLAETKNVRLRGLMTMAPYTDNQVIIRQTFSRLKKISEKLCSSGFDASALSMGMTNDYEIAVEEGSTILRIGTAIFGERIYK